MVAVSLAKARELGYDTVACASTGNLANAVAAHAAAAGLESYVFVPSDLEEQKLLATGVYGTNLVGVKGTYDDVNRLCTQLAETRPWAFVNVNLRPYYSEGSKTIAFETVEQLGWKLPDRVVCPVASGSLFTKIARGLQQWLDVGLVEGELPIFNGAQARGCSPVATAFEEGWEICKPQRPDTIAKSLAIGDPADGIYALGLARRSGGAIDAVSDDEIRDGIRLLAETTGIFTETAGGVTIAVLAKLAERGAIADGERVTVVITGEGLKTLDATRDRFAMYEIEPDLEASRPRCRSRSASDGDHGEDPDPAPRNDRRRGRDRGRGLDRRRDVLDAVFDQHGGLHATASPRTGTCAGSSTRLRLRRGHPLPGWPRDSRSQRATR